MSGTNTEIEMGPDQGVTSSISSYSLSRLVWAPRHTRRDLDSWDQSDPTWLNMWLRNIRDLSNTPWEVSRWSSETPTWSSWGSRGILSGPTVRYWYYLEYYKTYLLNINIQSPSCLRLGFQWGEYNIDRKLCSYSQNLKMCLDKFLHIILSYSDYQCIFLSSHCLIFVVDIFCDSFIWLGYSIIITFSESPKPYYRDRNDFKNNKQFTI